MLKVDIDKRGGGGATITAQGDIIEILADTGLTINGIHMQLKRSDPVLAQLYRSELIRLLTDPNTPLWKDDPHAEGLTIITPKFKEET